MIWTDTPKALFFLLMSGECGTFWRWLGGWLIVFMTLYM